MNHVLKFKPNKPLSSYSVFWEYNNMMFSYKLKNKVKYK